jgi:hypothetical protein
MQEQDHANLVTMMIKQSEKKKGCMREEKKQTGITTNSQRRETRNLMGAKTRNRAQSNQPKEKKSK